MAVNLASLGARTTLTGVVGRDANGATLRELLGERGIASTWWSPLTRPTITKLRVLSRNQQLIRLDTEDAFGPAEAGGLVAVLARRAADAAVCILSDYAQGHAARGAGARAGLPRPQRARCWWTRRARTSAATAARRC